MSYLGKTYTLEKHEKFDEFLSALGVEKDFINAVNSKKATQTLVKNGDTYTLTLFNKTLSFKPGEEFEEDVNRYKSKTTFVVDGDTFTQTQNFPNGRSIIYKKQYSGDKLVVEVTTNAWDGVAYRYYSA